jgi:hypothetical protein
MTKSQTGLFIALLFLAVIAIWAASWLLVPYFLPGWNERSAFGEMFGAVNALFSALAFAGLVLTVYLQTQELGLQRQEIRDTREELKRTAAAQEASSTALAEQVNALNNQAAAMYRYILNWQESIRPIVTARVATHSGGNVGVTLDIVVENTGNRPAKNVRLSVDDDVLRSALSENQEDVFRKYMEHIFSDRGMIPVLTNGRSATNSFGSIGRGHSEDATWNLHARFEISVSYEDLEGKRYEHTVPLLIADDAGFAGSFWSKDEKPDPLVTNLKELVRAHQNVEDRLAELVELVRGSEASIP